MINPFASPQTSSVPPHLTWAAENPAAPKRVKWGLTIVYFSICGMLLVGLAAPVSFMVVDAPASSMVIDVIMWCGIVFGFTILVGQFMCILVPAESNAKPLAIAAVILAGAQFLLSLLEGAAPSPASSILWSAASYFSTLSSLGSFVYFVLFMRRLAEFIVRYDVAARAKWLLRVGITASILLLCNDVLTMTTETDIAFASSAGTIFTLVGGFLTLISLVLYANMVTYLRTAIMI